MKRGISKLGVYFAVLIGIIFATASIVFAWPADEAVRDKCLQILPANEAQHCAHVQSALNVQSHMIRADCVSGCNNSTNWGNPARKAACESACLKMYNNN